VFREDYTSSTSRTSIALTLRHVSFACRPFKTAIGIISDRRLKTTRTAWFLLRATSPVAFTAKRHTTSWLHVNFVPKKIQFLWSTSRLKKWNISQCLNEKVNLVGFFFVTFRQLLQVSFFFRWKKIRMWIVYKKILYKNFFLCRYNFEELSRRAFQVYNGVLCASFKDVDDFYEHRIFFFLIVT